MAGDSQNGWNEYSRLVLKELESLSENIGNIREELQSVKQEIAKIQASESYPRHRNIAEEETCLQRRQ